MKPMKVGIIGVGNISPAYIKGCRAFDILDLTACADMNFERAQTVAAENQIKKACTVEEMLADPEIDIVINLTVPSAHAEIALRTIAAGKHPYSEKPLAVSLDDGRRIVEMAAAKGVRVGCAPDTFLFAEHQTARKLLDDGHIGPAVSAIGFMMGRGPEKWHPNPDFFYQPGAGPLFDMGPYYITCLVNLLGAVKRVSSAARASFPERIAKDGHAIPVNTPTHVAGTLEFESGPIATLIMSFDITAHRLPRMELYGAKGSLVIPDPNGFDPAVRMFVPGESDWAEQPNPFNPDWRRGVGVADMAHAIQSGRLHRASGDLALHVLEVMHALLESSQKGAHVEISSKVERPALLPLNLPARALD
ncbi:MAG: Gfo/Idh/MocA family oxidoreductase [Anaerolinea sp.]|nr:Gfo/Idh/MocA family oxidoreductase [Anaerolinea sp.]